MRISYDRLIIVSNSDLEDGAKTREIQNVYDLHLRGYQKQDRIDRLSNADLELLCRASNVAAFYLEKKEYVSDMQRDVDALWKRGLADDRHYLDLYAAYISARMFVEARRLLEQHPLEHAEKIPGITVLPRTAKEPWAFRIDQGSVGLVLQSVDISRGIKIVVVSHPLCHFPEMRPATSSPAAR